MTILKNNIKTGIILFSIDHEEYKNNFQKVKKIKEIKRFLRPEITKKL